MKQALFGALVVVSVLTVACGPARPTGTGGGSGTGGGTAGGAGGGTAGGAGGGTAGGAGGGTAGGAGGGTAGGAGGGTAGGAGGGGMVSPGSVTVISSGNQLPPAWMVTDATVLKSDNTGAGASAHLEQLVTLNVATMTSNSPCPLPFTSGTMTFCDGFNAKDSTGNAVVIDDFNYLGSNPSCKTTLPANGASLATITGVWDDDYNATTKVDTYVLTLTDCAGVGKGTPYAGTAIPAASTDIHALLSAYPATGTKVTVKGIVVATRPASTTGTFGFSIEDPMGGPDSAIRVFRSKTSTSTAASPAVGDLITLGATTKGSSATFKELEL